jgi:hypothetical protein
LASFPAGPPAATPCRNCKRSGLTLNRLDGRLEFGGDLRCSCSVRCHCDQFAFVLQGKSSRSSLANHTDYFLAFSPISTRLVMASYSLIGLNFAPVSCQHIEDRDVYYVNGPKFQRKKIAD